MFHQFSVWFTRIVVTGVVIALVWMVVIPKYFSDQPAAPAQVAQPAAPLAPLPPPPPLPADTAAAPGIAAAPAAAADPAAPATNVDGGNTAPVRRCQPIGRTARGVLVYSMDCRQ